MESNAGSTTIKRRAAIGVGAPNDRANPRLALLFSYNGREVQAVLKPKTPSYVTHDRRAAGAVTIRTVAVIA